MTYGELSKSLCTLLNLPITKTKFVLKVGYPPKEVQPSSEKVFIKEIGIYDKETILVEYSEIKEE